MAGTTKDAVLNLVPDDEERRQRGSLGAQPGHLGIAGGRLRGQ